MPTSRLNIELEGDTGVLRCETGHVGFNARLLKNL